MKIAATLVALVAVSTRTADAFVTPNTAAARIPQQQTQQQRCSARFMSEGDSTESAFVADVDVVEPEDDKAFDAVEKMGKGAAKVRIIYEVKSSTFARTDASATSGQGVPRAEGTRIGPKLFFALTLELYFVGVDRKIGTGANGEPTHSVSSLDALS